MSHIFDELAETIEHMTQEGKGILAADESNGTIGKRFSTIGVDNTADNRQAYRTLLAETNGLGDFIHSVILFEETFNQLSNGTQISDIFNKQGIIPGIKVDKGLVDLPKSFDEKVTEGLDGLLPRLIHFKEKGARFAKWRNVYRISNTTPSTLAIRAGAEMLARYASACQSVGIVPIVEPEILIDGNHSIEMSAIANEAVFHELFHALYIHRVELELIILKPSMITPGIENLASVTPENIALFTTHILKQQVPASVPSINFLSGGLSETQATLFLSKMNELDYALPWLLSFSYGRALQESCLKAWKGEAKNVQIAQSALLNRAKLNGLACFGEYDSHLEEA